MRLPKYVFGLTKFASRDRKWPSLCGINVANGRAEATDGSVAVRITLEDASQEAPAFLPADTIKVADRGTRAFARLTPGHIETDDGHGIVVPDAGPDHRFPDFDRVIPANFKVRFTVDAKYLADLCAYVAKHSAAINRGIDIELTANPTREPMRLSSPLKDGGEFTAVLMPLRTNP